MKQLLHKKDILEIVTYSFFILSTIEITGEFLYNDFLISLTKPLLLPLLLFLYWYNSDQVSKVYIIALVLNWCANVLFLSVVSNLIFIATILFMLSRFFILLTVYEKLKELNLIPIIIGSIPFLFLFTYLIYLIYDEIFGSTVPIVFLQCLIMSIIGGFSLGNYMMKNDEASKYLLVCSLCFALNIFALGVKYYYLDLGFLKPVSMIFFLSGHFIFLRFVVISEREKL
ncbi:hypothetical protein [Flavobacterium aquatile]|uniref:YhhN-like protein n=1 Tax=Flavobacterium aquatile LMG 4008 = ATCC 11947 TaxID=1453498 RepID=A0A095TYK5_9FLAO|nr:hypothetical protein [Flavobacterium aquatile]KGD67463.1 hypothetical protein LG45_14770 [Flavobacterium aquatile LMG 4008 = ATCC 11947]OXA67000.1 hypothetical protein B0A61_09660 [Flavobacterium aquatile LMG 4008 = ATCC 11947]GEC79946.1 hypothetical protein FAQ01_28160 [Flavobacterium aquatile]